MSVSPLPARGGIQWDRRNAGRALRVAAHPDVDLVTLSLWREDGCVASHQMSATDVSGLIHLLAESLSVLATRPDAGRTEAS